MRHVRGVGPVCGRVAIQRPPRGGDWRDLRIADGSLLLEDKARTVRQPRQIQSVEQARAGEVNAHPNFGFSNIVLIVRDYGKHALPDLVGRMSVNRDEPCTRPLGYRRGGSRDKDARGIDAEATWIVSWL